MFVCLQKDAKQCCDVAKLDRYSLCWSATQVVDQHNEYDRALWRHSIRCIFLETNKPQNLTRFGCPIMYQPEMADVTGVRQGSWLLLCSGATSAITLSCPVLPGVLLELLWLSTCFRSCQFVLLWIYVLLLTCFRPCFGLNYLNMAGSC